METAEKYQENIQGNPSILSSTGKFGVKGAKYFTLIIFVIGFINTIFLVVSIFKFQTIESSTVKYLLNILLVVMLGILFTAAALYFTYKYLLIDGISVLYKHVTPFFRKLSTIIIDKIEYVAVDKMHLNDVHLDRSFDVGNILAEIYGRKTPAFAKKGINYIVNKIPFADLIINIKDSIKDRDKNKASVLLYEQIDNYISDSILGGNSMKWLYWLIPLNIILQSILIYCITIYLN